MDNRSGSKVAGGGIFIAIGVIAGVGIGAAFGQPSIGLLVGFGIGVALAVLTWLMTR